MPTETIPLSRGEEKEEALTCPFHQLLTVLGKPHTFLIVYALGVRSPLRFTELQTQLKIQPKTLTSRLRELMKIGLVDRRSYSEIPPRVEYQLTQKGKDLRGLFTEADAWSQKYGYDLTRERSGT